MEEWKEWEGRGQEGGVWAGWVRGLSESLSESRLHGLKDFADWEGGRKVREKSAIPPYNC